MRLNSQTLVDLFPEIINNNFIFELNKKTTLYLGPIGLLYNCPSKEDFIAIMDKWFIRKYFIDIIISMIAVYPNHERINDVDKLNINMFSSCDCCGGTFVEQIRTIIHCNNILK